MERRKPQFAHVLRTKIEGESVVRNLRPGYPAQRRQAHAEVQPVGRAEKAHFVGHRTVALAPHGGQQGHHPRREVHRGHLRRGNAACTVLPNSNTGSTVRAHSRPAQLTVQVERSAMRQAT